jgi:MSHA biogenesis protein MshJ
VTAANRNRALHQRIAELDTELGKLTGGYVAPDKMSALLREVLATQQGLRLVSLKNLPVISLSQAGNADTAKSGTPAPGAESPQAAAPAADHGPFLHPVEVVVDGDYLSVVAYLHSLEKMPWRIHWQRLELLSGDYPTNRVRLVIGALSLSRDWMSL